MIRNKKSYYIQIVFIIICIAVNICGNKFTKLLELPFWLDTIGTGLTACVYGPLWGAVTGLMSNSFLGITDSVSALYGLINIGIGVIVGIMCKKGMMRDLFSTLCISIVAGTFSTLFSTILNCIFTNGYTTNKWGDALFIMLEDYNLNVKLRSGLAQAFLDLPDKVISLVCVFYLLKLLSKFGWTYSEWSCKDDKNT